MAGGSAKRLPFGIYHVQVHKAGFAPLDELVNIRSAVPIDRKVTLGLASVETAVVVSDAQTLLDPSRTGSVNRIGGRCAG